MKKKLFVSFMLLIFVAFAFAQAPKPTEPVLKAGDVEHFIKTFPDLQKDLENYGFKYEAQKGDMTIPDALKAKEDFLDILKKHNWDSNFFTKMSTILLGYSYLQYGDQIKAADSKLSSAMKEIESNPNIPAATKEQMKQQMMAAQGMMKTQGTAIFQNINPQDVALIKPFINEIKKIVDKQ